METTYYTLTAREIIAEGETVAKVSGGGAARQLVCVRRGAQRPEREGKVIDLAAWKADREEEARLEELWYDGVDESLETEPVPPPARERRGHARVFNLELAATLSVIAVMAALLVRIF